MSVRSFILATALALTPVVATAHSSLTASEPAADAVVSAPQDLHLQFNKPLRLVMITLTHADGQVVTLDVTAYVTAPAAEFTLPLPELSAGEWTVTWSALGTDGHAMREDIPFTVTAE